MPINHHAKWEIATINKMAKMIVEEGEKEKTDRLDYKEMKEIMIKIYMSRKKLFTETEDDKKMENKDVEDKRKEGRRNKQRQTGRYIRE